MNIKSIIFSCVVLSGIATTIALPIIAPLIRALQLSVNQGGWMLSIGSLVMVAAATGWGMASDRFGRKPVLLAGFAGLFLSYALFTAVVWSGLTAVVSGTALFLLLVVTRAIIGGFLPAIPAAAQALMADNTEAHDRSAGMAVIGAANGIGLIVGPALSGMLALQGMIWPFVAAALLCFAAFFVVLAIVPKAPRVIRSKAEPVNPFAPALLPWLLAGVLTMYSVVTVQVSGGFYFQDQLGLTAEKAGPALAIAFTLVGGALFLTQLLQMKVLKWGARRMMLAGSVFWVIGLLILLFTTTIAAYWFAYGLLGIGAGMLIPGYMGGASLAVPADRQGAVAGFAAATQGIGFILGPAVSTMLYEVDKSLPLWGVLLLMVLLFTLFAVPVATTPTTASESA